MDWYRWACARWRDQLARAPPAAPQTTPTKRPRAAGESPFKATSPLATLPAAAQEELLAEFEDSSSDEEDDEDEEDETVSIRSVSAMLYFNVALMGSSIVAE